MRWEHTHLLLTVRLSPDCLSWENETRRNESNVWDLLCRDEEDTSIDFLHLMPWILVPSKQHLLTLFCGKKTSMRTLLSRNPWQRQFHSLISFLSILDYTPCLLFILSSYFVTFKKDKSFSGLLCVFANCCLYLFLFFEKWHEEQNEKIFSRNCKHMTWFKRHDISWFRLQRCISTDSTRLRSYYFCPKDSRRNVLSSDQHKKTRHKEWDEGRDWTSIQFHSFLRSSSSILRLVLEDLSMLLS